jgi:hypothetical protein
MSSKRPPSLTPPPSGYAEWLMDLKQRIHTAQQRAFAEVWPDLLVPMLLRGNAYGKTHKHDRAYQFWQEGVHPELIQNEAMMRQKIEYIHHNPVKRGYVGKAEHWRYSSARDYLGIAGLLEACRQW